MDKPGSPFFNFFRGVFKPLKTPSQPKTPPPLIGQGEDEKYSGTGNDKFDTNLSINNQTMTNQLREAEKYRSIIESAARRNGFQPSIICGIGSRESHWGLMLKPPGPAGTGDFGKRGPRAARSTPLPPDGRGYGRGLMQIDYDWHEFARTGNWEDPKENIVYAVDLLAKNRTFFQERINLSKERLLRAIIAAYNCGATATLQAIEARKDIDANTTGGDYSVDVLNRSGWFQMKGWS